ncbi:hypothetical protein GOV04_02580 [Candidatus Woesearchaeota archaeon]|nr:hypothetical protein [Candidatus Woesearchaeota archaeon]
MKTTISKDTPLQELTLRRYERPYDLGKREIVRKLCLTLGLLQPGDSRDVIVDVLSILLENQQTPEKIPNLVIEHRKKHRKAQVGIAPSNIRRQLKRLKDLFIIEKHNGHYRITENMTLAEIFEEKIIRVLLPALTQRAKEYAKAVDQHYN